MQEILGLLFTTIEYPIQPIFKGASFSNHAYTRNSKRATTSADNYVEGKGFTVIWFSSKSSAVRG